MKDIRGHCFGYPLLDLAEAFVYREAFSVDWERHSVWEIHYVLSGLIVYEFENGRSFELRGGTFLAIPPRTLHRTLNGSAAPSERLAMRWLPRRPGLRHGQSPLFLTRRELEGIFATLARDGLRACVMPAAMIRSAKEFVRAIDGTDGRLEGLSAALLRHRCNDMLINLALAGSLPEPMAKGPDVVAGVVAYIDAHLGEKLTMRDLVRVSGYGATQLSKLFREKAGLTPSGYIVRARIGRTRRLLADPKLSLTEIALSCGFPSASYFSTVFRKYCGISPKAMRQRPTGS